MKVFVKTYGCQMDKLLPAGRQALGSYTRSRSGIIEIKYQYDIGLRKRTRGEPNVSGNR